MGVHPQQADALQEALAEVGHDERVQLFGEPDDLTRIRFPSTLLLACDTPGVWERGAVIVWHRGVFKVGHEEAKCMTCGERTFGAVSS